GRALGADARRARVFVGQRPPADAAQAELATLELARRLEAVLAELAQELGLESARDANEVVRELAFHEGVPGPPALRRNIDLEEDQDVVHADRVPARRAIGRAHVCTPVT